MGEFFELWILPERGFESKYTEPKSLENPSGHLSVLEKLDHSLFFFFKKNQSYLLKMRNRQWHSSFFQMNLNISAYAVNLFADFKTDSQTYYCL